ncbi:hypothetical protein COT58_00050 [Candidatus Micrarchaeota archaeon CG09_land_8_20_14_0_10_60_16]|nr:MAG: hypothetical protein COT58_00050 [Candidatus Micrarchaeota archaeon CG09_land_8_20_14_0_10_60_16]
MARFWEVDFARGAAVASMVAFNWLYALAYLGAAAFDAAQPANRLWAIATAACFVFLAGLSMHLASAQGKNLASRGAKIFLLGLLITAATLYFIPSMFVAFGILHLIGSSIIIASLFALRLPAAVLAALACAILALGIPLSAVQPANPFFLWLGAPPAGFQSVDYEPLIPWFGVFLFGIATGKTFYPKGRRAFQFRNAPRFAAPLQFLGRHSLIIYLVHQPLLVVVLCALGVACL